MSFSFAVVHEAPADALVATELADRVLVEAIDWLDPDHLVATRNWITDAEDGRRLTWKEVKKLAQQNGIRVHGHFQGEPALPDAKAARRAILYLLQTIPHLDAIVLIRDQDDQPERREGLEQARKEDHSKKVIVIGLAVVERESWVLSGFVPTDENEHNTLEAEKKNLHFDPTVESHRLTAFKEDTALRSAKRVLKNLTGNDSDRQQRCWRVPPLERLRERGTENGLAEFLEEIRTRLAPLIGHVASSES